MPSIGYPGELSEIAPGMPRTFGHLRSPTDDWIEYTFKAGEKVAFQQHRAIITEAEHDLHACWVALPRDLLLLRRPRRLNGRRARNAFKKLGLGESVDDVDFL
jgi:hypothetical protein